MVRQTSKWGQILLMALVGFGATTFTTAYFYRIDEIITVQGRLIPEKGGAEIKSPLSGQLEEIYVQNGELVKEGENLFRYEVRTAKQKEKTLMKQIEIERDRLQHQLKSNQQRQETLQRNIDLTEKILGRLKPLQDKGAISEIQILQQQNKLETQKDEMNQLKNIRVNSINDNLSKVTQLEGNLSEVRNRLRNEYIKSPISGTIFDLRPDSNLYVTANTEVLAKIVPRGGLNGEVNIVNQDIGFIHKDQDVRVRVDSFPFTQYGELQGKIKSIGADALPPNAIIKQYHFPVIIQLGKSSLETKEGDKIPLQAGMTISANVKLRDRRMIEILSDLFTNKSESIKRLRKS